MTRMHRTVQPEILDSLSADDPAALASRRDIALFNRLMRNFRWFGRSLQSIPSHGNIIELGSGDGGLGLYLKNNDILKVGSIYTGVDLIAQPADWPESWRWQQGDLLNADLGGSTTLLANLILHQFTDEELARVGANISNSNIRTLLINEPVRRSLHLWQVSLSRLLGIHAISFQDARTSVRAGFRNDEVCSLLGLDGNKWTFTHSESCMGANRIIGHRK
jgi:hypothetical protein